MSFPPKNWSHDYTLVIFIKAKLGKSWESISVANSGYKGVKKNQAGRFEWNVFIKLDLDLIVSSLPFFRLALTLWTVLQEFK